ncbi:MAG: hypothetical protein ACPGWR_06390 [Ardenticatenaceae bacterium]
MNNLVFIKLGGSLITDKQQRYHARQATIERLAEEMARARAADPSLKLLVGHGSGSFGHVAARESGYNPRKGHPSPMAFARVAAAASALNQLVRAALLDAGIPTISMPPSASGRLQDGKLLEMAHQPICDLLAQGIVPLVFGDVALHADGKGGGIASTEMVFRLLAETLHPPRMLLLGIVEGVFAQAPPPPRGIADCGLRIAEPKKSEAALPAEVQNPKSEASLPLEIRNPRLRFLRKSEIRNPKSEIPPSPPLLREITPHNWQQVRAGLGGSHGTDVTGGMIAKVAESLALIQAVPALQVRIVSGEQPGLLERLLLDPTLEAGTLIHKGA